MGTEAATLEPAIRPASSARDSRCPCCGGVLPSRGGGRRFTLFDAMVLVAASAVAFVIVRPLFVGPLQPYSGWTRYVAFAIGGLVTWTPTALALRLRRPRPALRRLSRQPGFAAGVAATAVLMLGLLTVGLLALVRVARQGMAARMGRGGGPLPGVMGRTPDPSWWLGVVLHFGVLVGPAVIGAWLLLAVSGRRRPTRDWLDLLGRALGTLWIVVFVVNAAMRLSYLKD